MRSVVFFMEMLVLLPMAAVRPFVGVLLWCWISFMSPHKLLWGPASSLPWALMTIVVTLMGCFVAREPKRFAWNPVTALILAFLLCITATSAVAMAPADDVFHKWSLVAKSFGVMLLTASLLTSKERIHALIWIMVLSLAFFGVKGGGFTLLHGGASRVEGPPDSIIADNNQLAAALLVTVPLMNYLRLQSKHRIVRYALLIAIVLTMFSIVGSYSRGALVGLLAMSAFLWLKSKRKMVAAIAIPAAVFLVIMFMPSDWVARMYTINAYQRDASAEDRLAIWHVAWTMAVHRPLTGAGFMGPYVQSVVNQFDPGQPARAVHSIWFEVLGEHGFITFFVWVGISLAGFMVARRIIKSASGVPDLQWAVDLARMSQVSVVAYLVSGTFLSLSYWDFYFTMLVAVAATREYVRQALGEPARTRLQLMPMRARLAASR
jgi:putative inorganic carbon (HCO3(-)) transporter